MKMNKVFRIDRAVVESFKRTPAGFIQTPAFLTKTGVLSYRRPDGSTVKELRHPEDVFNEDSLKTLIGAPITNNHPARLVDISNVKGLVVGYVGDTISQEGDFVKAKAVTIFDEQSILDSESGKVELSCGYVCDMEEVSGVYNGEHYDLRQRNIIYNHVSIVDEGRAGPEVRLRLDSNDAILESIADMYSNKKREEVMEKIMIDGVEYEVSPEVKVAFEKHLIEMKSANEESMKAKVDEGAAVVAENEVLKANSDEIKAKLDSALEENKKIKTDANDEKIINALAEEKMKVLSVAKFVLGEDFNADGLTNNEIKKKVLETKGVDIKTKSDVYVEARYDAMTETIADEMTAISSFGHSVIKRHDSAGTPEDRRNAAIDRAKNQWKNK